MPYQLHNSQIVLMLSRHLVMVWVHWSQWTSLTVRCSRITLAAKSWTRSQHQLVASVATSVTRSCPDKSTSSTTSNHQTSTRWPTRHKDYQLSTRKSSKMVRIKSTTSSSCSFKRCIRIYRFTNKVKTARQHLTWGNQIVIKWWALEMRTVVPMRRRSQFMEWDIQLISVSRDSINRLSQGSHIIQQIWMCYSLAVNSTQTKHSGISWWLTARIKTSVSTISIHTIWSKAVTHMTSDWITWIKRTTSRSIYPTLQRTRSKSTKQISKSDSLVPSTPSRNSYLNHRTVWAKKPWPTNRRSSASRKWNDSSSKDCVIQTSGTRWKMPSPRGDWWS